MKIKRATSPSIIKFLRPLFVEDGAFTRDIIAKELFNIMISTPSKIFVGVIFNLNEISGFAVAWVQDDREYVWLAQAYSKPGCDRRYGKMVIDLIKQWAIKNFSIHEIRFETNRNPGAIERVWGFKPHAIVMNCKF